MATPVTRRQATGKEPAIRPSPGEQDTPRKDNDVTKRLEIHDPDTCARAGSVKNSHKTKTQLLINTRLNTSNDVSPNDMFNNLFVYNEFSYPAKIRKAIRKNVTHSLEVVATLLPSKRTSHKNDVKCEQNARPLRVLLDSGGSANLVRKTAVKGLKNLTQKSPWRGKPLTVISQPTKWWK